MTVAVILGQSVRITFVDYAGGRTEVATTEDVSVMRLAVMNRIAGIVGECGGELQCATCHVYVEGRGGDSMPRMSDEEDEMLDAVACERKTSSRLSCQIRCTSVIDGLVVQMPASQY